MKDIKLIITVFALFSLIFFANCGNNDSEVTLTAQQVATQSLVNGSPWTVSNVTNTPDPNIDIMELESMSITFAASGSGADIAPSSISVSGAPTFISAQANASWSWSGSGTSSIMLSNVNNVTEFTSVTFAPSAENPTSLSLSFNISESGGRTQGLVGNYTIELTPQ